MVGGHGLLVQDVALINSEAEKLPFESPEKPEQTPVIEVSTAIDRATEILDKSVIRMSIYILVMLGAILLELWRFH